MIEAQRFRRVLVDAGPLMAICGANDQRHQECVETLQTIVPPLLTSWLVVAEAAYLLRGSVASMDRLLAGPSSGVYRIVSLAEDELPAMAALTRKYRSLGAQLADVSLVHLADREATNTIFTLDRRDFTVFRTIHGEALRLIPDSLRSRSQRRRRR